MSDDRRMRQLPRVLHVNDCAFVAETLCAEAALCGLPWQRYLPAPAQGHPALTAGRRIGEVARFRAAAKRHDVLHVHYGLMSYYARLAGKPFVLHLHGSDIRVAIAQNAVYRQLVQWGLRHAARVYYSTPDLAEPTLRHRPDAQWLPAPVSAAADVPPVPAVGRSPMRVLFASRWDDAKGATELLGAARRLRELRPDLRLLTVGWGGAAGEASAAGIEMLPFLPHRDFRQLLAEVDLVIGQLRCGALGVTEVEALAAGTPVVVRLERPDAYECPPPVARADGDSAAVVAARLLGDASWRARLRREGPRWARTFHGADAIASRLAADYAGIADADAERRLAHTERGRGRALGWTR